MKKHLSPEAEQANVDKLIAAGEPGRTEVGHKLRLIIERDGNAYFQFRALISGTAGQLGKNGKPQRDGIESVIRMSPKEVSLQGARDNARLWLTQCRAGNDPSVAATQDRSALTFSTFWVEYGPDIIKKYSDKEQKAWHRAVATLKPLHGRLLHQIDIGMVEKALKPLYAAGGSTPRRTRHKLERIFDSAKARFPKLITNNPAAWEGGLRELHSLEDKHEPKRHECMHYRDLPAFVRDLHHDGEFTARILEMVVFTAGRSQEVRGMRWEEIDLTEGRETWTCPRERSKMDRAQIFPLPRQAVALLKALGPQKEGFVFPSRWGKSQTKEGCVEGRALLFALRDRHGLEDVTAHGFRSTFRDYVGEEMTRDDEHLAELQLGHMRKVEGEQGQQLSSPAVVAAYARMTKVEQRRVMMQAFVDYACSMLPKGNVVQLRAA
jgi:integrase